MIESGAGESSSYSDKEYSDGAEVTKDTAKVLSHDLKVGPLC
jgi:alanine dehydrogenase